MDRGGVPGSGGTAELQGFGNKKNQRKASTSRKGVLKSPTGPGTVAHTYNPSTLGG